MEDGVGIGSGVCCTGVGVLVFTGDEVNDGSGVGVVLVGEGSGVGVCVSI